MRIWDITPKNLCNKHLIAEHHELHAIWSILTSHKIKGGGYSRHPETLRWKGKLKALYLRHDALVKEMGRRGYQHRSPLDKNLVTGKSRQDFYIDPLDKQRKILREKNCDCLKNV